MLDHSPSPRWDLSTFFPSLDSPEFAAAHEALGAAVGRIGALYEVHGVRATDNPDIDAVDEVLGATNALLDQVRLVNAYVHGFVATDARNDRAQSLASELRTLLAPLSPLRIRLDAWLASFDTEVLLAASTVASDHAHTIRRAAIAASHQLSEAEEALATGRSLLPGTR